MTRTEFPASAPDPLKRLLDPSRPLCREDVMTALAHIKKKAADGAPDWTGLDRPRLLEYFSCFADMAMLLLHRGMPGQTETARFRKMLLEMQRNEGS